MDGVKMLEQPNALHRDGNLLSGEASTHGLKSFPRRLCVMAEGKERIFTLAGFERSDEEEVLAANYVEQSGTLKLCLFND